MKAPITLLLALLTLTVAACGPDAGDEIPITSTDDTANALPRLPECGGAYYCTTSTGSRIYFGSVLSPGTPTPTQALASCNSAVAAGRCRGPCAWYPMPYCKSTCTCPK